MVSTPLEKASGTGTVRYDERLEVKVDMASGFGPKYLTIPVGAVISFWEPMRIHNTVRYPFFEKIKGE